MVRRRREEAEAGRGGSAYIKKKTGDLVLVRKARQKTTQAEKVLKCHCVHIHLEHRTAPNTSKNACDLEGGFDSI